MGCAIAHARSETNTDDLILVSIDDHVVEPPDIFLRHVPAKYKDEAPVVVTDDKGVDQWLYQGRPQGAHRGRCGSCANALVDVTDAGPHLGESGGSRLHSSAAQGHHGVEPADAEKQLEKA